MRYGAYYAICLRHAATSLLLAARSLQAVAHFAKHGRRFLFCRYMIVRVRAALPRATAAAACHAMRLCASYVAYARHAQKARID